MSVETLKAVLQLGGIALAIALPMAIWRSRRPPGVGYLVFCLVGAGLFGAIAFACRDLIQSNHGSLAALPFLIGVIVAAAIAAGLLLAAIIEALRAVWRGLRG